MTGPNRIRKENTMPETITREQLNEAIEEFADKIMEALGVTVADEEAIEPEVSGTRFRAINPNEREVEVCAEEILPGTVVVDGGLEYFRCYQDDKTGPWVKYTGVSFGHNAFAAVMRDADQTPRIIHEG